MELLTSQPITLWLSLAAILISVISLLHSLRTQRRALQRDAMQTRTQLLAKINELNSQALNAIMIHSQAGLVIEEYRLSHSESDWNEIKEIHVNLKPILIDLKKMTEEQKHNADNFPATDAFTPEHLMSLEDLISQVDRNKSSLDDHCSMLSDMVNSIEKRIKR